MPGLQAQPDVGEVEHPLDLPGRLDVGPGFRVERRLVATVAAASDHPRQARRETRQASASNPSERSRTERPACSPCRAARLGQGGPRRRPRQVAPHGVEGGQQRVQSGQRPLEGVRIGVGQLNVGARQAQAALGEQFAEPLPGAQVADRAEVDAGVARRGDLVQDVAPSGAFGSWPTVSSKAP